MYYLQLDCEPMEWTKVNQKGNIPVARHDSPTVLYNDKMYIFGGTPGTKMFKVP